MDEWDSLSLDRIESDSLALDLDWIGLDELNQIRGLDLIGLKWIRLDRIGLDWIGLERIRLGRIGVDQIGAD